MLCGAWAPSELLGEAEAWRAGQKLQRGQRTPTQGVNMRSRVGSLAGKRLPAPDRTSTPGHRREPSRGALHGLEKEPNRDDQRAIRHGISDSVRQPTTGEGDPNPIGKACHPRRSRESFEGRVECEITPTMLWMSSSKRYIWYFMLRYWNLPSKHWPEGSANPKRCKHLAKAASLPEQFHIRTVKRWPRGCNTECRRAAVNCCGRGGKRVPNLLLPEAIRGRTTTREIRTRLVVGATRSG